MNASTKPLRRTVLALTLLGAAVCALPFVFTLNDHNPPPDGTGLPIKWPAGAIRLRLMLGDTANLSDGSSFNQSARTAALAWNAILGSAQFSTENATDSPDDDNEVNELAFAAKVFGEDFGEDVLAVTTGYSFGNERLEADVIFNSAYTWDSYRGNLRSSSDNVTPDIQRVALHELGHVLGLVHPDDHGQQVAAIMNRAIGNRFELSADDTEGGQSLYGPPGVPANDNFANAAAFTFNGTGSKTITAKGHNTNATKETGEPSHANDGGDEQNPNPGGRSVWWRWIAPSAGGVTIDTRGSYCDTLLGVYTGTALANLTRIAGNDDIDPGRVQASTVTFTTTAGTTYFIAVDGFNNDDGAGADSSGVTLNLAFDGDLGTAPTITTQPASATVTSGANVSFSVVATGTAPLSYQWSLGGTAISGATSATHSIASATSASAGTYSVTVSNAAGSVTSNNATLTVNAPAPPPAPSGGGGGGGGGAPSAWFVAVLAALGLTRFFRR